VSGWTMVLNQGGVGRLKIAVQTFDAIDLHKSAFWEKKKNFWFTKVTISSFLIFDRLQKNLVSDEI
jgi:hypothetical protein